MENKNEKALAAIDKALDAIIDVSNEELSELSGGGSCGVVCTITAECYYGTFIKKCCPK